MPESVESKEANLWISGYARAQLKPVVLRENTCGYADVEEYLESFLSDLINAQKDIDQKIQFYEKISEGEIDKGYKPGADPELVKYMGVMARRLNNTINEFQSVITGYLLVMNALQIVYFLEKLPENYKEDLEVC